MIDTCKICGSKLEKIVMDFNSNYNKQLDSCNFQYERTFKECSSCFCFQSSLIATILDTNIFSEQYYEKVDKENLSHKFQRVMSMNRDQSDNLRRVERIQHYIQFYQENFQLVTQKNLLDIGSGTGVFPAKFQELSKDWNFTLLEPDPSACKHLQQEIKKSQIVQGFLNPQLFSSNQFDLITFNRCLEHMPNPVEVLKVAQNILKENGLIYIEVPDTLTLSIRDQSDEAFGDAHLFIFSPESLNIAFKRANLTLLSSGRTKEPSGKFTTYAFATKSLS
ncbi:class I SAM-dependent methyltransferase [bacterium]|nr:class I SAM-dependent methyltransferase [bacterium]